jgi:hypothetical protein
MRLAHAFAFVAVLILGIDPSHAEKRVALIIGNAAYTTAPRLPNARNDAEDVAAALKRSGFETIVGLDLDKAGMDDAGIRFARAVRDADVALLYYSGHAMQFAGVNYLMPIDVKLTDEADLRRMTRVDEVVADLQQARALRILVLDACRDNPLAEELKRSIGLTRAASMQRGLARIDTPQGMIVAFSTQAGTTASDGAGRNSPYTAAFMRHIEAQEEIGTVFRRVSAEVYEATKRVQLPELSLSLIGEFYLRGKPAAAVVTGTPGRSETTGLAAGPSVQPAVPSWSGASASTDEVARAWEAVKDSTSIAVLDSFVRQYGQGNNFYASFARARIEELKAAAAATRLPEPKLPREEPKPLMQARLTQPADLPRPDFAADCDRLAADPRDAQRPSGLAGVAADRIDFARAFTACSEAAGRYPQVARFHYQAGRVAGEQKDYASARAYYERAAAMGSAVAMTGLAVLYGEGLGVTQDLSECRRWLEKAAAAGDTDAIEALAELARDSQSAQDDFPVRDYAPTRDYGPVRIRIPVRRWFGRDHDRDRDDGIRRPRPAFNGGVFNGGFQRPVFNGGVHQPVFNGGGRNFSGGGRNFGGGGRGRR